jgi:hypothetical protein
MASQHGPHRKHSPWFLYTSIYISISQSVEVKYLGLHLDRRLTWHKHIFTKRKQLGLNLTEMHWLLGRKFQLSTTNYYSIKPYSNYTMVYNSGALLPPPTLKFWNDSNLRSCVWLWTPYGTSLIHSSEGTSAAIQSKKNSAVTALTMVIDFAPIWQQTSSTVSAYWSAWQILINFSSL